MLALGLNFAVAPKRVPYREIIASTEATGRQLDQDRAKQLRICVSGALHKARPPPSNLSKGMRQAIKDLKQDTEIVILPADKGNATVVMNQPECDKDESDAEGRHLPPTQKGSNSQGRDEDHPSTEDPGREQLPIQQGKALSLTKLLQTSPDLWSPKGA